MNWSSWIRTYRNQFHFLVFLLVIPWGGALGQRTPNETTSSVTFKAKVFKNRKGELTIHNITQGRRISTYEDGGTLDCTKLWLKNLGVKGKPKGLCDENEARDFVWSHWISKCRGYIRVRYAGIDTASTAHIFIEPDKTGRWVIRWRSVGVSAILRGSGKVTDFAKIAVVEQIKDKPGKGEWALMFKNVLGKFVWTLPYFPL